MLSKFTDVITLSKKLCDIPLEGNLKYASSDNFLGRQVEGYHLDAADVCLLTTAAATSLCDAQNYFVNQHQCRLRIYDAYRPLRAIKDFQRWIDEPIDTPLAMKQKQKYFPHLEKSDLLELGYIATGTHSIVSRHCFGNAVDLVLVNLNDGTELDMGAIFDYFDEISHVTAPIEQIGQPAWDNRQLLQQGMRQADFMPYKEEFWHFDYHRREIEEPADFEITKALKGLGC